MRLLTSWLWPIPVGARGVGTNDPVKRATLVAVAIEAAHEVPAVLMAESDRDILRGHFKLVGHAPAREVPRREIEAPRPSRGGPDDLPVIRTRTRRPMLAAQRDEAELTLARQPGERVSVSGASRR